MQQPVSVSASVGQTVNFSVVASGTAPISFQWQKNGTNITNANQSTYTISSLLLSDAGDYRVVVSNSVSNITSEIATLNVTQPNQQPTAIILTPANNTLYTADTNISFSGQANDPEQGDLPASAFSWQIDFHHDTHKHDEPPIVGIKQGSYSVPNQGETSDNVWYRFVLTVKDVQGLVGKDSVDVYPRKSTLLFETIPSGLQLTLDGQPFFAPKQIASVQGILRTIGVVTPQTLNGKQYQFSSWSNAGTAEQTFATPSANTNYTAVFSIVLAIEGQVDTAPYPNPASNWIYFDRLNTPNVLVYDNLGRASYLPVNQTDDGFALFVGDLPSGMYLLRAEGKYYRIAVVH